MTNLATQPLASTAVAVPFPSRRRMNAAASVLLVGSAILLTGGCRPAIPPVEEISGSVDSLPASEATATVSPADWPAWRGPNRNGTRTDMTVPTTFSPQQNVVWKTDIPGRGHADPTVVGDSVLLATAEEQNQTQSVVCLDRHTGRQRWQTTVHTGGFEHEVHNKATQASGTVASDGTLAFAAFLNDRGIHVTALDIESGGIKWQQTVGGYVSKFGYSASPLLHHGTVIIAADHQDGGFIAALRCDTGDVIWRKQRPADSTYASPVVAHVAGKDQLLICGASLVSSFNPDDGEPLWECAATTTSCVGTIVWDDQHVFASGGYPGAETVCIKADGSAAIVWKNGDKSYVPSILYHDGHVYAVNDKGVAYCWNASTGQERWKARVGGNYSASPALIGNHIYAASEEGTVTVFRASPDGYQAVAQNVMGDEIFASPVAAHGRLFLRVAHRQAGRTETVYCIGDSDGDASADDPAQSEARR